MGTLRRDTSLWGESHTQLEMVAVESSGVQAICSSGWTRSEGGNRQGRRTDSNSWYSNRADTYIRTVRQKALHQHSGKILPAPSGCPSVTHRESHFLVPCGLKLQHRSVELTLPFTPCSPDFAEGSSYPYRIRNNVGNLCGKGTENVWLNSENTAKYPGQEQHITIHPILCLKGSPGGISSPHYVSQIKILRQLLLHPPNLS